MRKFPSVIIAIVMTTLVAQPALAAWAVAVGSPYNTSISADYNSLSEAKKKALQHCRNTTGPYASRCKIVASGQGQCVGTAYNGGVPIAKKQWFVATGATKSAAQSNAVDKCSSSAPGRCVSNHGFCDKK